MFSSKREHFCRVYVVEPCITETERSIKHCKKSWWKWESKSLILQYDQWLHLQTLRRFQYVQWWHFLFRQLHQKKGTLQQTLSLTVKQLPRLQQRRFIASPTVFILMLVLNIVFSAVLLTKFPFKFKLKRPCRRRCRVKWMGLRLLRPFYVTTQIALWRKQQWRPTSKMIFLNVIQTKAAWVIFASHLYIWYQRWSHKAYRASQSGFLLTSMLIIKRLLWENSFAMQLRGEKEGRDWWRGSEGRDGVRETEKHRGGHVWRKGEKGPERDRMIHFTSPSQLSYSVRAEGLCWSLVPCTEQAIANFIKDVISTRDLKDVSPQPSV